MVSCYRLLSRELISEMVVSFTASEVSNKREDQGRLPQTLQI